MTTDIVTIGDTKIEVDLDGARKVEHYRIGDKVKLLKKHYDSYRSYPGVIVGFDAFKARPTIIVCYLDADYSSAHVKFAYLNKDSEDIELAPMLEAEAALDKADLVSKLEIEIQKKEAEVGELCRKRQYFLDNFNKYFKDAPDAGGAPE